MIISYEENRGIMTIFQVEMNFDGLREDKVLLPGGVLRFEYVDDRTSSAATGACNSVSFIYWKQPEAVVHKARRKMRSATI